jgi:uncharacterized protein
VRPETQPWWRQAQADLQTAEITLQAGQCYAVSWFAQQAAEKALKALYLERHGQLAPRTHDLGYFAVELAVPTLDPALTRFAERLREELGAQRVLLFGSHARGTADAGSDYDLIIVAEGFRQVPRLKRAIGLRQLFYASGGHAPIDLICLTPEEFDQARQRITLVAAVLPEAIDLLPETEPSLSS